jgi:hypothetical protein
MTNPEIEECGNQIWCNKKGQFHREDGPAYINPDGYQSWYTNGKYHHTNKSFQKAANLSDEDMTAMILKYGDVN